MVWLILAMFFTVLIAFLVVLWVFLPALRQGERILSVQGKQIMRRMFGRSTQKATRILPKKSESQNSELKSSVEPSDSSQSQS